MFNILINLFNRKFLHYDAHAFLNFDMAAMAIFVFLNRSFLHRQQLNLGILFRDSRHSQTCARGTLFAWPSQQKSAKKGDIVVSWSFVIGPSTTTTFFHLTKMQRCLETILSYIPL